jgi:hypothetical protein
MANGHGDDEQRMHRPRGPKGGVTTRSMSGMVKKNLWLTGEMAARLRQQAEEDGIAEAEIFRRALARWFRDPE